MRVHTRIQKWGNGLALRVCGPLRDIPQFKDGTEVEVEITNEGFIVKKRLQRNSLLPFTEAQLIDGLNEKLAHTELLANPLSSEFEQDE